MTIGWNTHLAFYINSLNKKPKVLFPLFVFLKYTDGIYFQKYWNHWVYNFLKYQLVWWYKYKSKQAWIHQNYNSWFAAGQFAAAAGNDDETNHEFFPLRAFAHTLGASTQYPSGSQLEGHLLSEAFLDSPAIRTLFSTSDFCSFFIVLTTVSNYFICWFKMGLPNPSHQETSTSLLDSLIHQRADSRSKKNYNPAACGIKSTFTER